MALQVRTDEGILHLETDTGASFFAIDRRPGAMTASFGIYVGDASGEMFDAAIGLSNEAVKDSGRVVFICDGLFIRRYDSSFRERWTNWFLKHRGSVEGLHFSLQHGLPKMGLQLVNLAVPGFARAYDSDAALDETLGPRVEAFNALRRRRDAWRAAHAVR